MPYADSCRFYYSFVPSTSAMLRLSSLRLPHRLIRHSCLCDSQFRSAIGCISAWETGVAFRWRASVRAVCSPLAGCLPAFWLNAGSPQTPRGKRKARSQPGAVSLPPRCYKDSRTFCCIHYEEMFCFCAEQSEACVRGLKQKRSRRPTLNGFPGMVSWHSSGALIHSEAKDGVDCYIAELAAHLPLCECTSILPRRQCFHPQFSAVPPWFEFHPSVSHLISFYYHRIWTRSRVYIVWCMWDSLPLRCSV